MRSIKIPNAVIDNQLQLDSDTLFVVVCLLFHHGEHATPKATAIRIARLLGARFLFEEGFAKLIDKQMVDQNGQLGGLFAQLFSKGLCKPAKWGFPSPYHRFDEDKMISVIDGGLKKTSLMVWIAMTVGVSVGTERDGHCSFCGVSNRQVRVAKAKLQATGLLPKITSRNSKSQKPYTVSGELEEIQIDSLVAEAQESVTLELAKKEGRETLLSGIYSSLKQALPSSYLGFLRYQSQELSTVLEQVSKTDEEALKLVGRIPRVYIQGFTDGWNEERFQRGLDLETFAIPK